MSFVTPRTLVAGTTLALVLIGASACNADDSTVKSTPDSPQGAASSPASKGGAADTAKVGDTITLKGMDDVKLAVTLLKVVNKATGKDDIEVPDAGKRFFAVQVMFRNVGQKAYDDAPTNGVEAFDGEGQKYDAEIATDVTAGPSLATEIKLAPGSMTKGYVVFQVPVKTVVTKVQLTLDSGMGSQVGEWKIGL